MLMIHFQVESKSNLKLIFERTKLAAHTSINTICRILLNDSWPNEQFMKVAKGLKYTKVSKEKGS